MSCDTVSQENKTCCTFGVYKNLLLVQERGEPALYLSQQLDLVDMKGKHISA